MENINIFSIQIERYEVDLSFIRERRMELDLTQGDLASYLGYQNSSSYYKLENGDITLNAIHLPVIAQVLKCNLNSLYKKCPA